LVQEDLHVEAVARGPGKLHRAQAVLLDLQRDGATIHALGRHDAARGDEPTLGIQARDARGHFLKISRSHSLTDEFAHLLSDGGLGDRRVAQDAQGLQHEPRARDLTLGAWTGAFLEAQTIELARPFTRARHTGAAQLFLQVTQTAGLWGGPLWRGVDRPGGQAGR
jgi:hypothetical protein